MKMKNIMNTNDRKLSRVAMYIWYFLPLVGGAEKQCKILSEELVKKGTLVFIVTERLKGTKKFEIINGVQIYRVSSLNWLRRLPEYVRRQSNPIIKKEKEVCISKRKRFGLVKWLSKILTHKIPNYYFFISSLWTFYKKRKDFDIIHIHESQEIACFGIKIAKLLNKKVVIKELISGDLLEFKEQFLGLSRRIAQADCFIAISDAISRDMISLGIPKERVKKIPNGVDLSSDIWKNNDFPERPVICMTKINQLPNKGIDVLLEAWKILVQKHNRSPNLKIYGRGNPNIFYPMLTDLKINNCVHFSGFAKDVRRTLLGASLFILPSRREGLSNSLLEAMSLGMPCIATDISGNQDLIQHGKSGLLVSSGNANALADAVIYMLDNPGKAKEMGYNARTTIEQQYNISYIADRYIELYRELIKNDKE